MTVSHLPKVEIFNWHPSGANGEKLPDVDLPFVRNEQAQNGELPKVLLVPGLGETYVSGVAGVQAMDVPAVAVWLDHTVLPFSTFNLELMSIEAPQALAEYLTDGKGLHLFTNSLGCLTVNAAVQAPELFKGVGVQAPYAFAHESLGKLPLFGAKEWTRVVAMAVRLGIVTPLQFWHRRDDEDLKDVGRTTFAKLKAFGSAATKAIGHATSPQIGARTTRGFIRLALDNHPAMAFIAREDRVVPNSEARKGLKKAVLLEEVDPAQAELWITEHVQQMDGPHAPWCTPEGQQQLAHGAAWIRSLVDKQ